MTPATTKPGWLTSECHVTVLMMVGAFATAASGHLDGKWAAIASGVGAAAYAYCRMRTKNAAIAADGSGS